MHKKTLIACLFATVLSLICIKETYQSYSLFFLGERADAICTKVQTEREKNTASRHRNKRRTNYYLSFSDSDGQMHEGRLGGLQLGINLRKGQTVPIVYHSNQPNRVFLDSIFRIWSPPVLFSMMLACFTAVIPKILK